MNFPLYIARRIYTENGDKNKISKPALHIATAGVAIGLAVMVYHLQSLKKGTVIEHDKSEGLGVTDIADPSSHGHLSADIFVFVPEYVTN
mgnify:CR=1 FL=1